MICKWLFMQIIKYCHNNTTILSWNIQLNDKNRIINKKFQETHPSRPEFIRRLLINPINLRATPTWNGSFRGEKGNLSERRAARKVRNVLQGKMANGMGNVRRSSGVVRCEEMREKGIASWKWSSGKSHFFSERNDKLCWKQWRKKKSLWIWLQIL